MTERTVRRLQTAGIWLGLPGFVALCWRPTLDIGVALVCAGTLAFLGCLLAGAFLDLREWRQRRLRRPGCRLR